MCEAGGARGREPLGRGTRFAARPIRTFAELHPASRPIQLDVNRTAYLVPLAVVALAGCAHDRWLVPPSASPVAPASAYRIACPDVLEVRLARTPEYDCLASVGVDGLLTVGPSVAVAVAGLTAAEAGTAVAAAFGVPPTAVTVTVADPRAGTIGLHGPESNRHRLVPYRGPESALEFLLRTGAMKRGCFDPRDVSVLRPNVASGHCAEVFRVDLDAILLDGDGRTNLTLAAGDQVYVGESRRSSFARLLPTRWKPIYQRLVGIVPDGWPWVHLHRRPTPLFADR